MATADQIKMLIKAHYEQNEDKFKTTVLQIAAYEANKGHVAFARDIKELLDVSKSSRIRIINSVNKDDLFLVSFPDEKIKNLVVSPEITEKIERVLNEYRNRAKLKNHGLANRRKLLLEGNPGTGKTMTASILASELDLPLYVIQMDKLITKYMGETSVKLRQIFDSIRANIGVYLFDEFDAIGGDRSLDNEVGEMRRILNSFLQFIETDSSESLIVAATNNRQMLDRALFRRFDDVLHYDLPSSEDAKKLIKMRLGKLGSSVKLTKNNLETIALLSQSEIVQFCDDALKTAILSNEDITAEEIMNLSKNRLDAYSDRKAV